MIEKLAEWLEEQGFSLEMRAAAAFRKAGFKVRQSAHYIDRGEGKSREMDVIATHDPEPGRSAIHFAIECKSGSKPWIVLVSSDTLAGIDRNKCVGILTHEGLDAFSMLNAADFADADLPWYCTDDECGYSLRKAHSGNRDDAYTAASAVCKAAQWTVLPMQMDSRALPTYAISFPIIVVDSPIFECRLNATGELNLKEVKQSQYLFEDHVVFDALVRIRVVHIDALPDFACEGFGVAERFKRFFDILPAPRTYNEQIVPRRDWV